MSGEPQDEPSAPQYPDERTPQFRAALASYRALLIRMQEDAVEERVQQGIEAERERIMGILREEIALLDATGPATGEYLARHLLPRIEEGR